MSNRFLVAGFTAIAVTALAAMPAAAQTAPRTPWGAPDLQGIWDFRTITPLERPEDLGDQAFYTAEEASSLEQEAVERDIELWEREAQRTEAGGNVGAYNNFWMDRGTKPIETRRTSLITAPPTGRFPELSEIGQERADARRAYLEEHPADSYADRNTSDRCIVGVQRRPPDHAARLQPEHAALPDSRLRRDPYRDGAHLAHRAARRPCRPRRRHPSLDGRLAGPLGRRHPGHRVGQLQRPAPVDPPDLGGFGSRVERYLHPGRALHPRRRGHPRIHVHGDDPDTWATPWDGVDADAASRHSAVRVCLP